MYNFESALFWYKFIFMTELLAAEGTFIFLLKERPHFLLRIVLSVLGLYAVTFALPIIDYSPIFVSILFCVLFIVSLCAMALCFKERWAVILFCGIWAYTVQHLSYILGNYLTIMTNIPNGSVYEETITGLNIGSLLIGTGTYLCVYFISFFVIKRLFRNLNSIQINGFVLVILSIISLSIEIVINSVVVYLKVDEFSKILLTVCYVYDTVGCVLTIGLLVFSLWNKSLQKDKSVMALMLKQERENFELRKDNVEKINIMCHDLKHRIRELGETGYAGDKLQKLESALQKYGLAYRTGNVVLDVILAGFGARCTDNGVQFVCMADGAALNGFEEDHLYSLFDNALNNAFEAVSRVAEPDKRYVGLQVVLKEPMISVRVENYFVKDGDLVFVNGLPQTTKSDGEWHGFGMRSIRLVVENYGGGMSVEAKNDLFVLSVFLPRIKA